MSTLALFKQGGRIRTPLPWQVLLVNQFGWALHTDETDVCYALSRYLLESGFVTDVDRSLLVIRATYHRAWPPILDLFLEHGARADFGPSADGSWAPVCCLSSSSNP